VSTVINEELPVVWIECKLENELREWMLFSHDVHLSPMSKSSTGMKSAEVTHLRSGE
jgi:hypothetical protein